MYTTLNQIIIVVISQNIAYASCLEGITYQLHKSSSLNALGNLLSESLSSNLLNKIGCDFTSSLLAASFIESDICCESRLYFEYLLSISPRLSIPSKGPLSELNLFFRSTYLSSIEWGTHPISSNISLPSFSLRGVTIRAPLPSDLVLWTEMVR